jgi:hypothetical protein
MNEDQFESLRGSFDSTFTEDVMNKIRSERMLGHRVMNRLTNFSIGLAAASIILFVSLNFAGIQNREIESIISLSEYSDFELNEMDYFNNE